MTNLIKNLNEDIREIKDNIFAIIIYGSYAKGTPTKRSDIDVCVVAKNQDKLKINNTYKKILKLSAKTPKYDIRIFEQMPLFMKMEVIENGKIIYVKDLYELNEYFYFFRKLWEDQSVNRIYTS